MRSVRKVVEALFQEREALGEHRALVVELRQHGRVVQQQMMMNKVATANRIAGG
jgi:hypothetical protein